MQTAKFVGGMAHQTECAMMDGVITVACPHCGTEREIEADGFYNDVECEGCSKHYKTVGVV